TPLHPLWCHVGNVEKPGNCPRPEIFCSHRDWQDGRGSCTTDRDCPGREKCCAPRCRRECKNVDGGKWVQ
uniref:WAP domain-containing protein n=1 Tax=Xenopus tropicalis TaxID=8364 RepID=A0A803JBE2_XENTR